MLVTMLRKYVAGPESFISRLSYLARKGRAVLLNEKEHRRVKSGINATCVHEDLWYIPAEVLYPGMVVLTNCFACCCCSFNLCFCSCTRVDSSRGGDNRKWVISGLMAPAK